ncbi:unnamed protein product [Didymodactylos carnosus]|uniref:Uncharacterized protein n=1 Tax=Didymodactylos carnosus TaxID=1234261 RepID=A0A8S2EIE9_9BILA|nr:unnamed protein product [Didymodactylos carnosus]CAF4042625.1 unnamed protein product [Didymodactylos carnosus]
MLWSWNSVTGCTCSSCSQGNAAIHSQIPEAVRSPGTQGRTDGGSFENTSPNCSSKCVANGCMTWSWNSVAGCTCSSCTQGNAPGGLQIPGARVSSGSLGPTGQKGHTENTA